MDKIALLNIRLTQFNVEKCVIY